MAELGENAFSGKGHQWAEELEHNQSTPSHQRDDGFRSSRDESRHDLLGQRLDRSALLHPLDSVRVGAATLHVDDSDFEEIAARHTPSPNNVESLAVILFFELADWTRVEVAKIDDTEHQEGRIHIDRYYRGIGAEIKDFDIEVVDCWAAGGHLKDRWDHYASTYLNNHGAAPRSDGMNV